MYDVCPQIYNFNFKKFIYFYIRNIIHVYCTTYLLYLYTLCEYNTM